jgi:hypothetical protein
LTSSEAAAEWDLVVPASGDELLAELGRHGFRPGQHVHLRVIPDVDRSVASRGWTDDLATALSEGAAAKRPPFRTANGLLAGAVPAPDWEEFEAASEAAASDVGPGGTLPG